MKKKIFISIFIIAAGISIVWLMRHPKPTPMSNKLTTPATKPQSVSSPSPMFNKKQFSITQPDSLWVIASKTNPLSPLNYAPSDLTIPNIAIRPNAGNDERTVRRVPAAALETMFAAAKRDGIKLMLASGYRSYQTQVAVYNSEVASYGQAMADTESARPGHSEHQTGLAADIEDEARKCEVTDCFGDLPEGKWLAANAYKYGFIIRYPADKVATTGYRAEPWHIRYIGPELAAEMHKQAITTLEEFFDVKAAKQPY